MKTHVMVFTRYPVPGTTKTRLIPAIGPEKAAKLQQNLTSHTLEAVRKFAHDTQAIPEVHFSDGDKDLMRRMFGDGIAYLPQTGGSLGERLTSAFEAAFQAGADRVIVIGSDCPRLDSATLAKADALLEKADMVIGPAEDGGYYLLGLKAPRPELFQAIPWGGGDVLSATLQAGKQLQLTTQQLRVLPDVDYPEDLIPCRAWPELVANVLPEIVPGRLSVIIPALNESERIASTIRTIRDRSIDPHNVEIIVSDGGSNDDTCEKARQEFALVVNSRAGRGVQMNTGAVNASGDTLLFLHADAQLPSRFDEVIRQSIDDTRIAGAFRLKIDGDGWGLKMISHMANLRSRVFQRPYGDQGLFLKAETFYELGGFRNWPLMEDFELVQRLRKKGKIDLSRLPMTVSARRWQRRGIVQTTCLNQLIILAWRLGVSPERLAAWYRRQPATN